MEALYPSLDLLPHVLLHALLPRLWFCPVLPMEPKVSPGGHDSEIPVPPALHPSPRSLSLARDPVRQASWSIVGVYWAHRKPLRCSSGCPSSSHSPPIRSTPKTNLWSALPSLSRPWQAEAVCPFHYIWPHASYLNPRDLSFLIHKGGGNVPRTVSCSKGWTARCI